MFKRKKLFLAFEGIEASGKSYQIHKLLKKIKKIKYKAISTREPGGSKSAEVIRRLILSGKKSKFHKLTDTFLYLASRNEHFINFIKPNLKKKQIILCDRFTDSTYAYQVYGKQINKLLVDISHKEILGNFKPDFTFVLVLNLNKSFIRLRKRKKANRYDKLSKIFYLKAQKSFIKTAKMYKRKYMIVDTTKDNQQAEKIIYNKFIKLIK